MSDLKFKDLGVFEHRQNSSISVLLLLGIYLDEQWTYCYVLIAFHLRHDLEDIAECLRDGFG